MKAIYKNSKTAYKTARQLTICSDDNFNDFLYFSLTAFSSIFPSPPSLLFSTANKMVSASNANGLPSFTKDLQKDSTTKS